MQPWTTTRVFDENLAAITSGKRTVINQGGTSSSKTWSILQVLHVLLDTAKQPALASVVSESTPHLKRGCIRDWRALLADTWNDNCWNATDHVYTIPNRNGVQSRIEFFSADEPSKMRGGRRDFLFLNEANNISKSARDELECRTAQCEIIDYNPVIEFWANKLVGKPGVAFVKSTYMDARAILPQQIVDSIESRRDSDPNWWRVYGLGEIGGIENLVYTNYEIVADELWPTQWDDECYGLDFGFNNPSALVHVGVKDQEPWLSEVLYASKLTNEQLIEAMIAAEVNADKPVYCDSAEPARIESIGQKFYAVGAKDAKKSVVDRITFCKTRKIRVRASSTNIIKELRGYMYKPAKDNSGRFLDEPVKAFDHAMNAFEYAYFEHMRNSGLNFYVYPGGDNANS